MKKTLSVIFIILTVSGCCTTYHTYGITTSGVVCDKTTHLPIEKVKLIAGAERTFTNEKGQFTYHRWVGSYRKQSDICKGFTFYFTKENYKPMMIKGCLNITDTIYLEKK